MVSHLKSVGLAATLSIAGLLFTVSPSSAAPAPGSLSGTNIVGIIGDASQVTKIDRRGRHGHRGRRGHSRHHGYRHRSYRHHGGHLYGAPYFGYYGYPYYYYEPYDYDYIPAPAPRYRGTRTCRYWHRRCVANWGYRNPDYRACMHYHGCRPR
jgi:hypothetical protein